jgi:hypothetical protein
MNHPLLRHSATNDANKNQKHVQIQDSPDLACKIITRPLYLRQMKPANKPCFLPQFAPSVRACDNYNFLHAADHD